MSAEENGAPRQRRQDLARRLWEKKAVSAEENSAVIRRWIKEVWSEGNLTTLAELVGPGYANYGRVLTPEEAGRGVLALRTAFPDLQRTVDDLIVQDDKVVARTTFRGTHCGEYLGVAATGKQMTWNGITIYRLADGKLAEEWPVSDRISLGQQLGLTLRPE